MNSYNQQAMKFLNSCPAEMQIIYAGRAANHLWGEKTPRDMFSFIIKTKKGTMTGIFWDSLYNTKLRSMTPDDYCKKKYNRLSRDCTNTEKRKAKQELESLRESINPKPYDILACFTKYPVGSMDDFMHEFGYEIKCASDITSFIDTYNAVVKEYNDLCRIFTPEQMEILREIN